MAIPDFQTIMLPLLKLLNDGNEHLLTEIIKKLADYFKLTEEEREELLPSGTQRRFYNRIGWARTELKKAGFIENNVRGIMKITKLGQQILSKKYEKLDRKMLIELGNDTYKEFLNREKTKKNDSEDNEIDELDQPPQEELEKALSKIMQHLAEELLSQVKSCSPDFFEKLVIDLLLKMGYGGSRKDAARTTKKTGDEGIDGVINEDKLGLDVIYIQAKRWENVVGRPEVQKFAGALQGQRAKKGIFITTSTFTKDAKEYASFIDTKIRLIDGEELSQLMINYDVGVSTQIVYKIKKIDSDYFIED